MFSSEQSYNKLCTSERASFRIHACIAKWQSDVYRIGAVCRTIMQYFVNICKVLCILFEELFWKWNKPSHQIKALFFFKLFCLKEDVALADNAHMLLHRPVDFVHHGRMPLSKPGTYASCLHLWNTKLIEGWCALPSWQYATTCDSSMLLKTNCSHLQQNGLQLSAAMHTLQKLSL